MHSRSSKLARVPIAPAAADARENGTSNLQTALESMRALLAVRFRTEPSCHFISMSIRERSARPTAAAIPQEVFAEAEAALHVAGTAGGTRACSTASSRTPLHRPGLKSEEKDLRRGCELIPMTVR